MPLTLPVYPPLSLQNRFSKDGLSSALGVRSKEIGMSPFSMHFIKVILPEVRLEMEAFFHKKKKRLELPLPNVLGLCFETQMK